MSDVKWKSYDWQQLVAAADTEVTYYDVYRFSGRTFRQRDETNYVTHEETVQPPEYTTVEQE